LQLFSQPIRASVSGSADIPITSAGLSKIGSSRSSEPTVLLSRSSIREFPQTASSPRATGSRTPSQAIPLRRAGPRIDAYRCGFCKSEAFRQQLKRTRPEGTRGHTMSYEKIVTLYDTAEHAEAARRNLEAAGFSPRNISMVTNKTLTDAGDKL